MTTKKLKTIKFALAVSSAVIFFNFLAAGDGESGIYFLDLFMGLYNFFFFLALIALSFLALFNYISTDDKYNVATNIFALLMVVSFIIKSFIAVDWFNGSDAYIYFGLLPPVLMLTTLFMLDGKLSNKSMIITAKLLNKIKLVLAMLSVAIFCILFLTDIDGFDFDFFGLLSGPFHLYFFLGLAAVLILTLINYFSALEKFKAIINILIGLIAASFVVILFSEITAWGPISFVRISFGLLLPVILLAAIFMLDRNLTLKQAN